MCETAIKETSFVCRREGLAIKGMEYRAERNESGRKYSAIIVSHGFMGNYTETIDFCRAFAEMGYAAYGFSFCGGGSFEDDADVQSDGDSTKMTIWSEVEDLLAIKEYVKSLPYIDGDKVILMGFSQGGFVSGLAAARCGSEIEKLIMVYPALCIPDHARRGCLGGASYHPEQVPDIIDCARTKLGKVFHDTVADTDAFLEISAYKGPVLILHGLEDEIVNYSYSVRAKENYEKGQCRLQLIRNMGHGLNEEQKKSVLASIQQFLINREELFAVRVIITHQESEKDGDCTVNKIYFTGYCESEYFSGTILPGACDTQVYRGNERISMRADYTFDGIDGAGERCSVHIVNQEKGGEWKPDIHTSSNMFSWVEHADVTAVLELDREGLVVRFYAEMT